MHAFVIAEHEVFIKWGYASRALSRADPALPASPWASLILPPMVRSRQERKRSAEMPAPEPGPRNAARQRVMSDRAAPGVDSRKAGKTGKAVPSAKSIAAGSRPRAGSRKVAALPPSVPASSHLPADSGSDIEIDLDMVVEPPQQTGSEAASPGGDERHRVRMSFLLMHH